MTAQLDRPIEDGQLLAIKSVTDNDIPKSVYYISFGMPFGGGLSGSMLYPQLLPANIPLVYDGNTDFILYQAGKFEGRWASAVHIATTKVAAKAFELKSDKPQLLKRYSELLHDFEGKQKSPVYFFSKMTRDYLGCDNGTIVEIDRESGGAGSRIKGLYVLDSRRCIRTGRPDTPIIYTDLLGKMHELKDYQVVDIVDQPETSANLYGTGECAARRAYNTIRHMNVVDKFVYEKISGARPLALDFISGISEEQLKDVLVTNEASRKVSGNVVYGGTVVIPSIKMGNIDWKRIPIADLPEGFDREKERSMALQDYANAIGIDSQELIALTGQALGTGAQSQVLDDKQEGKGLVTLLLEITHMMQQWVLPDAVSFFFSEKKDMRDQKAKADIFSTYATAVATLMDKGVINQAQALQTLVDSDQIAREFLPVDLTPAVSISDTEKPEAEQMLQEAAQAQAAAGQPLLPPPPTTLPPSANNTQS
jgi:hypothetical protein